MNTTSERKKDHIEICLNEDVSFHGRSSGFEQYEFEHFAATEVDISQIDLSTDFFGKKINYPFLISAMTGGTAEAEKINRILSEAAAELNIAIGVGSQRQALENDSFIPGFKIVREIAGSVPALSNIGAGEVAKLKALSPIQKLVESINADALVIHLNPLQELIQPEGNTNFIGLARSIERICSGLDSPVIVKEVGAGISKSAAKILLDSGVGGIDTAGAGGTSWSAVEMERGGKKEKYFREWGLPTTYSIRTVAELKSEKNFVLIASGGINDGVKIAKSISLGADITASALPILKIAVNLGTEGVIAEIKSWFETVKKIMYLTGCADLDHLKKNKLIKTKELY